MLPAWSSVMPNLAFWMSFSFQSSACPTTSCRLCVYANLLIHNDSCYCYEMLYCLIFLCHSLMSVANSYCCQLSTRFISFCLLLLSENWTRKKLHVMKNNGVVLIVLPPYLNPMQSDYLSAVASVLLLRAPDPPREYVYAGWALRDVWLMFDVLLLRSSFSKLVLTLTHNIISILWLPSTLLSMGTSGLRKMS